MAFAFAINEQPESWTVSLVLTIALLLLILLPVFGGVAADQMVLKRRRSR